MISLTRSTPSDQIQAGRSKRIGQACRQGQNEADPLRWTLCNEPAIAKKHNRRAFASSECSGLFKRVAKGAGYEAMGFCLIPVTDLVSDAVSV